MATISKSLMDTEGNTILPKTRTDLVYRPDNATVETTLASLEALATNNNIIYNCTHVKTDTTHTVTGLPTTLTTGFATVRFRASGDFVSGDTMSINGIVYTPKLTNMEDQTDDAFKTGAIIALDLDIDSHYCFFKSGAVEVPKQTLEYTYTGSFDGTPSGTDITADPNWKIQFKSSGTFTLLKPDFANIDVFLVGGGGGGGSSCGGGVNGENASAGGGGGGYTKTQKAIYITSGTAYNIVVGSGGNGSIGTRDTIANALDGGSSSAFSFNVNGGKGAVANNAAYGGNGTPGGAGGSGGGGGTPSNSASYISSCTGGSNGSDGKGADGYASGSHWSSVGGKGQGTTTKEFGEASGELYAGGGGAGGIARWSGSSNVPASGALGGEGGGGAGGTSSGFGPSGLTNTYIAPRNGNNGIVNKGGGGGSAGALVCVGQQSWTPANGGNGGSGIVIIRNMRGA